MLLAENEKLRKDLKRSNEQVWSALGRQAPRRASLPPARPGPSRLRRPAHTTASTSATAALTLLPRVECAVAARARAWPSRRVRLLRHRCREIRLDLAHPPAGMGHGRESSALAGAARAQRPAGDRRRRLRPVVGAAAAHGAARRVRAPYAHTPSGRPTSPLGICAAAAAGRAGVKGCTLRARNEPFARGCSSAAGDQSMLCALRHVPDNIPRATTYGIQHTAYNMQPDSAGSACRCFPVGVASRVVVVRELHTMCSREPCDSY
jgi:hypothetical protein